MQRINEHKFELNNEEYLLTWHDKPKLTKNGIEQKVKPLLREYITTKNLPIQIVNSKGNDEVPYTLATNILKHFSNNTFKIKKVSKSIKLDSKSTLINSNSNSNPSNSKDKNITLNKEKIYLIPCSSSKISKEKLEDKPLDINKLEFNSKLGMFRKELISKLKIAEKNKTHKRKKTVTKNKISKTETINITNEFDFHSTAQANQLYSKGNFYRRNSSDSVNWTKKEKEKIFIVSALFGIIRADNYIPLYDLAMNDEIDKIKNFAQRFWNGKLDVIIENLISNGYLIYNLLGEQYNNSIKKSKHLTKIPHVKFSGSDADEKRGKWLKANL